MEDLMLSYKEELEVMTEAQIREVCPTAFATTPSSEVSKHYTHIPTNRVIDDMSKLGWGVVDAKQVAARKKSTPGFQKHMITFRNPDVVVDALLPVGLASPAFHVKVLPFNIYKFPRWKKCISIPMWDVSFGLLKWFSYCRCRIW